MIGRLIGTHPCQDGTNIPHHEVKTFTKFIVIVWLRTVGDESIVKQPTVNLRSDIVKSDGHFPG